MNEYVSGTVDYAAAKSVEGEQSQVNRALVRLEKADAELAVLLDRLAERLRPVRHLEDSYEDGPSQASPPSMRAPLVVAIDGAADRCSARSRLVAEITEELDI